MPMKNKGRKTYRSMQGKVVDLDLLIKRNELTPAVGNAKVNARGDELGPGGKIIRKREEVVRDYYDGNRPVADEIPTKSSESITAAEAAAIEEFDNEPVPPKPTPVKQSVTRKAQPKKLDDNELQNAVNNPIQEEWVEDEDGNFVKKGD